MESVAGGYSVVEVSSSDIGTLTCSVLFVAAAGGDEPGVEAVVTFSAAAGTDAAVVLVFFGIRTSRVLESTIWRHTNRETHTSNRMIGLTEGTCRAGQPLELF